MRWRTTPREDDRTSVRALVAATGFFSDVEQDMAVELLDEALTRGSAGGYQFVFDDRRPGGTGLAGYACYGAIPLTEHSYDLYWIAVAPDYQGRGRGAALLREVERRACAASAERIFAETSGRYQYAPTRAFYRRMGYTGVAVLRDFYKIGDDKVIFAKSLGGR